MNVDIEVQGDHVVITCVVDFTKMKDFEGRMDFEDRLRESLKAISRSSVLKTMCDDPNFPNTRVFKWFFQPDITESEGTALESGGT